MRAVQVVAPQRLELTEVEAPVAGPGEVVLAVEAAGLCHSDLAILGLPMEVFPLPLTLGHEIAGRVAEVGPGVDGWSVGQRAVVHLVWSCGSCSACLRGDDNVCHAAGRMAQPPTPGLGPAGGMADRVAVPARFLVPIGDLDPTIAAPLADAAMTPYHAIRNSSRVLVPGATAVVTGIGGLGHVAVQLLRTLTGARIIAVDTDADRLDRARELGADATLTSSDSTAQEVLDLTEGRGAELVLDLVGSASTTSALVECVAPDGFYQLVGIGGGVPRIVAEPRFGTGWPWGASLRTSYGGTMSDLRACVALAQAGRITIDRQTSPLSDAVAVFGELEAGRVRGRAVLVP